ncbi:gliding motility lipoprotein GldH [Adhaeribacter terreus]|uniref:Gliding motility lipoprotein GldH n=1 Tax=Adhaeribacter terreus TaxID=529703 RepID=A0ABW0EC64_9BACT
MKKYLLPAFVMLTFLLSSCDKNRIFEQNQDLENNSWPIAAIREYKFEVKDTSKKYAIYFNVRNAIFYEYYNLYMKHTLIGPDGKTISTNLHELYLMDKKSGKPLGDGAGDIFDHQVLAIKDQTFDQPGTYTIKLQQYMRRDPLPGIMSVGVRVETQE